MLEAEAGGVFQQEAFFQLYAEAASDSGDAIDLEHAHCHRDGGSKPYRVDGYAFDQDRGILYLAVCDFRNGTEVETLNAAQIDTSIRRVINFFENALRGFDLFFFPMHGWSPDERVLAGKNWAKPGRPGANRPPSELHQSAP